MTNERVVVLYMHSKTMAMLSYSTHAVISHARRAPRPPRRVDDDALAEDGDFLLGFFFRAPPPPDVLRLARQRLKTMLARGPSFSSLSAFMTQCSKSSLQLANIEMASPSCTRTQCDSASVDPSGRNENRRVSPMLTMIESVANPTPMPGSV